MVIGWFPFVESFPFFRSPLDRLVVSLGDTSAGLGKLALARSSPEKKKKLEDAHNAPHPTPRMDEVK
jgi:hypothetical protein